MKRKTKKDVAFDFIFQVPKLNKPGRDEIRTAQSNVSRCDFSEDKTLLFPFAFWFKTNLMFPSLCGCEVKTDRLWLLGFIGRSFQVFHVNLFCHYTAALFLFLSRSTTDFAPGRTSWMWKMVTSSYLRFSEFLARQLLLMCLYYSKYLRLDMRSLISFACAGLRSLHYLQFYCCLLGREWMS